MLLQKPNSKPIEVEVEPKKQRKKSRWFYKDTAREDELETNHLKSDPDYRAFKGKVFSKLF